MTGVGSRLDVRPEVTRPLVRARLAWPLPPGQKTDAGSAHMHDVLRWVEVHPGLAAWVQAVGSIFAVTAAASLPFIHGYLTEKRETKVRLAALFALAQQSVTLLEDLAEAMKTESGMRDYMHLGVTGEWTELRAMLASFPLWDVVQQDLATQIGHLRHAVTVGHSIAETIPPGDIADSNFDIDRSHIEGGRILAIDARDAIAKLL
jgi:hypothetical protein